MIQYVCYLLDFTVNLWDKNKMKFMAAYLAVAITTLTFANARCTKIQKNDLQAVEGGAPVQMCSRDFLKIIEVAKTILNTIISIIKTLTGMGYRSMSPEWQFDESKCMPELLELMSKLDESQLYCRRKF